MNIYDDRMIAIRTMLADSDPEIQNDGYDTLFLLWLENADSQHFLEELLPVAEKHQRIVQELDNRLETFSVKEINTKSFLRHHLDILASEVAKIQLSRSRPKSKLRKPTIVTPERKYLYVSWWKWALFIAAILFPLFILPDFYQKIIVIFVAVAISISMSYIIPKNEYYLSIDPAGLSMHYILPTYLSIGDENAINISIENSSLKEVKGRITFVFDQRGSFVIAAPEQNLSVNVSIPSHSRESKQFKFKVIKELSNNKLGYHFEVTLARKQYLVKPDHFLVSSIPFLRSTWTWLFGGAGVLVALAWKQLEKLLGL